MAVATKTELVELVPQEISYDEICEIADSRICCAVRLILTAELCRRLLAERNTANRGLRKHHKDFLKSQMINGQFVFTGETLIFGLSGLVLNGQHRLTAASEAGVPIELLVVFGIEDKYYKKMDQVAARSGADTLHVEGKKYSALLAATLRHVDNYETAGVLGNKDLRRGAGKMSNDEIVEILSRHRKIEASVRRADRFTKKCKGLTSPSLVAALHYLFSSVDPTAAEEFIAIVEEGCLPNKKYDETLAMAAVKLKRVLENSTRGPRRAPQSTLAACWVKAWNAYWEGDVPQMFYFRSGETFPKIAGF